MKNIAVRDTSLDNVCAIMIIYMIYGHVCLWCGVKQNEILTRCLYFFMPWFFFKSGMFFRTGKANFIKGNKTARSSIYNFFNYWAICILDYVDIARA